MPSDDEVNEIPRGDKARGKRQDTEIKGKPIGLPYFFFIFFATISKSSCTLFASTFAYLCVCLDVGVAQASSTRSQSSPHCAASMWRRYGAPGASERYRESLQHTDGLQRIVHMVLDLRNLKPYFSRMAMAGGNSWLTYGTPSLDALCHPHISIATLSCTARYRRLRHPEYESPVYIWNTNKSLAFRIISSSGTPSLRWSSFHPPSDSQDSPCRHA